jgi:hypothetical protein
MFGTPTIRRTGEEYFNLHFGEYGWECPPEYVELSCTVRPLQVWSGEWALPNAETSYNQGSVQGGHDPKRLPEMTGRQLTLDLGDSQMTLFVDSAVGLEPIDDYREVNFELIGKGRHRAVFFLLPDKKSDDPYATIPDSEWDIPVRWDDNTMLFVPTLDDESILAAMKYVLTKGLEGEAFENENDIRLNGG